MTPTPPPPDLPILIPDPDDIRDAIDFTDERGRLLRQLLRVATRLRVHFTAADRLATRKSEGGRTDE